MSHQVSLTWVPPSSGDAPVSYDVRRATVVAGVVGTFASIASPEPTAASYVDTAVTAGVTYAYEVSSVNASGESTPSTSVTVTIPTSIPNPPTGLAAVAS